MRKVFFHGKEHSVDPMLAEYKIERKPSTNVEFFGDNGSDVFIQFKNGKSYIYKNVSKAHIAEMYQAESIGQFISAISKLYTYVPVEKPLIKLVLQPVAIASYDAELNATIVSAAE